MKPSLLDTDIVSEFLRGNTTVIAHVNEYLEEYGQISISVITYYEILNGLYYKDARKQITRFNAFAELNNIIPLTKQSAKVAAEIEAQLRKKGKIIGHTDTLIAGIAISNNLQLVTNNTAHFKRIKDLKITNWLR